MRTCAPYGLLLDRTGRAEPREVAQKVAGRQKRDDTEEKRREATGHMLLETGDTAQKTERRGQKTEDRGRQIAHGRLNTEDGGRKTDAGRRKTEDAGLRTDNGGWKTKGGRQQAGFTRRAPCGEEAEEW